MRDSGRDRDPAGCEVSRGSPAGKRAHLGSASAEKLLTEEPSCEAEDMTAPTTSATPKITLDLRAAMVWTPPSRRGLRSAVNRIEGEPSCRSLALVWIWRNTSSRFTASIARGKTVVRKTLRRHAVSAFFANLPPCLVGMEASNGAHFWAKAISELGHDVRASRHDNALVAATAALK